MNIYLIEDKEKLGNSLNKLKKYGKVVALTSGQKDIKKYRNLFDDQEDKIIAVGPGVIEWNFPVDVIKNIKNLKGICTKSSWAYFIDIEYCKENNIVVCNTPGANSQSVAEYAILMMLTLARKLPLQIGDKFKPYRDGRHLQIEVMGKTMGVIGLGNVGRRIAKLGKGLGMKVIYWSPRTREEEFEYKDLNSLLKESDFIFNCVEIKGETRELLNKNNLSLLKSNAYFLSVMGGMGWGTEDDDYLIEMVNENKIAGMAIENEHNAKYVIPKIKKGSNVFIAGAYAWYTTEARERSNKMWEESIVGIIKGKPVNVVN
jgi:phosphoglycerate dehydrogenase-like enzyme